MTTLTSWKVIGRYWNACAQVVSNLDCAGGSSPIPGSTTHPDQHAAMIVPDGVGSGVTLYAGNDGGAYKQHVSAGQDFSNDNWGDGINTGLRHAPAVRRADGQRRHGRHGPAGQRRGEDQPERARPT